MMSVIEGIVYFNLAPLSFVGYWNFFITLLKNPDQKKFLRKPCKNIDRKTFLRSFVIPSVVEFLQSVPRQAWWT
jgi:hypothetical protein